MCVYLVDTFCLGVKNVIGPETVSNNRLPKLRYTVFAGYDELPHVHAPLELAQHLVFGAVKFAREFGFEPHPDFAAAADHLGAWSGRCPIQFGYKGSPVLTSRVHTTMLNPSRVRWPAPRRDKHWA